MDLFLLISDLWVTQWEKKRLQRKFFYSQATLFSSNKRLQGMALLQGNLWAGVGFSEQFYAKCFSSAKRGYDRKDWRLLFLAGISLFGATMVRT